MGRGELHALVIRHYAPRPPEMNPCTPCIWGWMSLISGTDILEKNILLPLPRVKPKFLVCQACSPLRTNYYTEWATLVSVVPNQRMFTCNKWTKKGSKTSMLLRVAGKMLTKQRGFHWQKPLQALHVLAPSLCVRLCIFNFAKCVPRNWNRELDWEPVLQFSRSAAAICLINDFVALAYIHAHT